MRYLVLPSVRGIIPRPDTDLCISHVQNHKDFGQILKKFPKLEGDFG